MSRMRAVSILLTVAAIGLFVWYFMRNMDDFAVLLDAPWWTLAGVAAGFVLSIIANGYFVKLVLDAHKKPIQTSDAVNASVISAVGNFFFPVGVGSAAQAKYLKQRHAFSYTNFIASLSGNYILVFLVNGALGLLALLMLYHHADTATYWTLVVVFAGMLLPNLYFAFRGLPSFISHRSASKSGFFGRVLRIVRGVLGGWNFIVQSQGLVAKLALLIFVNFIASMIIGYFSIMAAGVVVGFWPLVLYSALGAVTLVLNITPGSIGVREGVFLFAMSIIGLSVSQVLVVSLVERGVRFFVLLAGLAMFSKYFKLSKQEKGQTV